MNRPETVIVIFTTLLLLIPAVPGNAAPRSGQDPVNGIFGVGLGYLTGNTLYHISSYDAAGNGIESELEFPLKTFLAGLEGGFISKDGKGRDEFRIHLQWLTNIGNGSGQLKDSDWLTGVPETSPPPVGLGFPPHPGLDIYSESDITLKANIIDIRGSYNSWLSDRVSIGPLGGFLYQNFQFDASNVNQVGYGPYAPGYTGFSPGPVLTYEVTYTILYLGVHSEIRSSKQFQTFIDLGYSPWVSAEDKDDHLLRYKLSKGSATGNAYLAAISAMLELQDNDSFLLQGQYLRIDSTGTQTQTWYRAPNLDGVPAGYTIAGIHDKITSEQTSITLLFNHRF